MILAMGFKSYGIGPTLSNRASRVYTRDVKGAWVFALFLSASVVAFASGSQDSAPRGTQSGEGGEIRVLAFTLAEADNDGNRLYTERMAIPEAVSLAQWTRFSRAGREVKMDSAAGYGLRQKRPTGQELSSGVIVQAWELTAAVAGVPKRGKQPVRVEVSFGVKDCLNQKGKVLYQPARMAVTRAVIQENWGAGEARLVSIARDGPGRFSAVVELR
jgi:hypothetical protein